MRRYSPSSLRQQRLVLALLDDPAAVQDDDPVGVGDRAEPVRDDERRPLAHQTLERLLHGLLRLAVERGCRFVQDEDARVLEQRAGDGHALALPATQLHPAFAHKRVVAIGQIDDELVRVGCLSGGFDFLGCRVELAVANVVDERCR